MGAVKRPSEIILVADGPRQAHGGANSNFYGVSETDNTSTSGANAATPIATAGDVGPSARTTSALG